ncbi:MAG: polysaccharide deacetylase family protein [Chloroflexi bacterium]|nr:polysaccharide deacetylase family protein [Chloroflexota bacterium]
MGWGSPERPWIALTFDAELGGEMGTAVLDTLRAWDVRATFFITGAWARHHPDLVQRMVAEGHPIGNHTDSHARLIELSDEAIRQELRHAQATLMEIAGHDPRPWFRPPFGKRDARVRRIAAEERYLTVVWSIDVMNWLEANSPQSMLDKALNEAGNGSIIVFHLNRLDAEALPAIIQGLRARGYRLVTLAELLAP